MHPFYLGLPMAVNFLNVATSNIKHELMDQSVTMGLSPATNSLSVAPSYQQMPPNTTARQQQQQQQTNGPIPNFSNFTQFIAQPTANIHTGFYQQPLLIGENNFNIQPELIGQNTMNTLHAHQFTSNTNVPIDGPDNANLDTETANLSSLLNIDSQQLTYISSMELAGISLSLLDGANQPETIKGVTVATTTATPTTITNIFNDINRTGDDPDGNMSNSFTRLQLEEIAASINEPFHGI